MWSGTASLRRGDLGWGPKAKKNPWEASVAGKGLV